MSDSFLSGSSVLVTGGTGSFGRRFVEVLLAEHAPRRLVVFSRDEMKQHEMRQDLPEDKHKALRYFIGDVRDVERLKRAMDGVDYVVHAAALKQIQACEYNPMEAVLTNLMGAKNVIDAALDSSVKKVMFLSTDKAVSPVNLYGATKLCAEKLVVQSNSYSRSGGTTFSCVRYGNVFGSRASIVPVLLSQRQNGRITLTDSRMTRFCITLNQGVQFVVQTLERSSGGEVWIPKIPSVKVVDILEAVAEGCEVEEIGIRPGEKLHEVLLSEDEARHAVEFDDMFVIEPLHPWWRTPTWEGGKRPAEGYHYSSDNNDAWLDMMDVRGLVKAQFPE
jgi:UDP-N-acetylglucosamine 4,6-dehydratase